jgi:hypothetical protein
MKPLHGMARTLGFGLLAALGAVAWQLTAGQLLGQDTALASYALLCACGYPLAVAPGLRAAFGAAMLCAPLALVAGVLAPSLGTALLAAALLAALARGSMYRAEPARTLLLETALLVLSLAVARLFAFGGPLGAALGLWGYFLTQSAFFLLLRPVTRVPAGAGADPFDAAHARALELLARR